MPIGLICAIPEELGHLREALVHGETVSVAHARFDRGFLDGHEVVLVGAGIGKVNTSLVATLLADRLACRLIVFSGVAGGLDPALDIGDVVTACEYLADQGLIGKASLPVRLTRKSNVEVQETAFFDMDGGGRDGWRSRAR